MNGWLFIFGFITGSVVNTIGLLFLGYGLKKRQEYKTRRGERTGEAG